MLNKLLTDFKLNATERIVRYIENNPSKANIISEISFLNQYDERIMDSLIDERSFTFPLGLQSVANWTKKEKRWSSLFLTPHFLHHFDFNNIRNGQMVNTIVIFLSNQLGFFLQNQTTGSKDVQSFRW